MKILLEETVNLCTLPKPYRVNIFSGSSAEHPLYFNIEKLGGKSFWFSYQYTENNEVKENKVSVTIPTGTDVEIKDFVINTIKEQL
jgi:hypothetical protein